MATTNGTKGPAARWSSSTRGLVAPIFPFAITSRRVVTAISRRASFESQEPTQ